MRFLLIVLLLANLALFLYVRGNEAPPASPPPPVAADKIVLVKSLAEGEPVPAAPPASSEPAMPCLEWGPLADMQLDNARAALGRIAEITTYQEIRRQGPTRSWLVSLDGFDNRTTAVNRANELRRQGISDISVLEPGPGGAVSTFSLSLGVFSSEQGAQSRAAALNVRKIGDVKVSPRPGASAVFFIVPNASPALAQHLRELPARFADSAVQGIACPPPQTP